MSPTTREPDRRRGQGALAAGFDHALDISPAEIDHYLDRGRQLRAEAMAGIGRRLGAALGRALHRLIPSAAPEPVRADDTLSVIAGQLRSPLTSIRTSAEILRDNADIGPAERSRFLSIVLAEEARLEALVSAMLDGSSVEPRRGVWRVPLKHLRQEHEQPARCA